MTAKGENSGYGVRVAGGITIIGGSVQALNGPAVSVSAQPKNTAGAGVYLAALTLEYAAGSSNANELVTALTIENPDAYAYGIRDMYTDNAGLLYLWLPEGENTVAATAGREPCGCHSH